MSFILTIILIYLLFVLLRPVFVWLLRRFVQHQTRKYFGRQFDAAFGQTRNRQTQPESKPAKKKVFDRSDGEYVEFEEVAEERTVDSDEVHYTYRREEQVTDADWTEVKD